ncbi:MAG: branched-chain amino acid ABC transporter permease [Thermoleophilia bacterium]|nr:branched-chain amino acid ABC transporter permease [Thermoleophilia bacterium]
MTFSRDVLLQALASGLMIGGVFALISIGLTLIWGVMKIINFAQGEFLMIGLYLTYFLVTKGINPYITMVITTPALFLIGAAIFRVSIRPILRDPSMNQIMLTLGLSLMLQNLALAAFGGDVLRIQTPGQSVYINLGPVVLSLPEIIAFVGSIVATLVLYFYLQRTDMGRNIRAASQSPTAATLMGIDVRFTYLFAFGIGSATLGVASALLLPTYYTSPTVGLFLGLIMFVVVVLGGMGNFLGAFIGGLIIGLTENIGAAIFPGSLSRVFTFGIFILVLLFKPQGILSRRRS